MQGLRAGLDRVEQTLPRGRGRLEIGAHLGDPAPEHQQHRERRPVVGNVGDVTRTAEQQRHQGRIDVLLPRGGGEGQVEDPLDDAAGIGRLDRAETQDAGQDPA